jgi:hypothetical protein
MKEIAVGNRYALAIYDIAKDLNRLEEMYKELKVVNETSDTRQQGTTSQTTGDDGSIQVNVFVADIRSEGSMAQVLERTYGLSRMGA